MARFEKIPELLKKRNAHELLFKYLKKSISKEFFNAKSVAERNYVIDYVIDNLAAYWVADYGDSSFGRLRKSLRNRVFNTKNTKKRFSIIACLINNLAAYWSADLIEANEAN